MNNIDLSGLKGLHIPTSPDVFPLALGWWILIAVLALILFFAYTTTLFYFASKKHFILKEINRIKKIKDNHKLLLEMNELAKKVAISYYGREKIAPLYEKEWIDFLNSRKERIFSKDYVDLLHKNLYANESSVSDSWRKRIIEDYEKWIMNALKK